MFISDKFLFFVGFILRFDVYFQKSFISGSYFNEIYDTNDERNFCIYYFENLFVFIV